MFTAVPMREYPPGQPAGEREQLALSAEFRQIYKPDAVVLMGLPSPFQRLCRGLFNEAML
jgi:hypothetical protein